MDPMTPKQRMLNAYRGLFSDRTPVAPEFWYYYPAKILGVGMMEFERELPFWQSLQTVFRKYGTEGWGAAFPDVGNADLSKRIRLDRISEGRYRESTETDFRGRHFTTTKIFDSHEPSWVERRLVAEGESPADALDMLLSPGNLLDVGPMNHAHRSVGEDYLLEAWLGTPFFDFMAELMGFEETVLYFVEEDTAVLEEYRRRYVDYQKGIVRRICRDTPYESFVIGCSYSCNSLIGPSMWRTWDKPYLQEMADEIHRHGKLLHIHFHGRAMETVSDFAEIGIDCVCPFERSPGGDVDGVEGLRQVRALLKDRTTMNGNVHTVETLIRGTPEQVRREVREIREAFEGSARLIIGTGDQVGEETPEENILAMIEEAQHPNGIPYRP
jgi:hypothetical protein